MQSDIYVDKDYDKAGHRAIKHSETPVFMKFCGYVFIKISQVIYYVALSRNAQLYYLFIGATEGGNPGTVFKAACLESRWSRVRTPLWPSRKQNVSFSLTRRD